MYRMQNIMCMTFRVVLAASYLEYECFQYDLSRVACFGYQLPSERLVFSASHPGFELFQARVVLGTNLMGFDLSIIELIPKRVSTQSINCSELNHQHQFFTNLSPDHSHYWHIKSVNIWKMITFKFQIWIYSIWLGGNRERVLRLSQNGRLWRCGIQI